MNIELMKNICTIKGASGEESRIAEFIISEIKDIVDDYKIDPLGNLIAHKKGPGKKIMLAGHMDQIGMMVTHIDKEGFCWFSNIGGLTPSVILNARVVFSNGTFGVIGREKLDDPAKPFGLDKMYIDIGAANKEEAEKRVKVGDIAVYYQDALVDEDKIVTPYLDDRIGCYIIIEALKRLKDQKFDIYAVFTVQEELGLRGARASAFSVDPDYGLAFDVTGTGDTPKADKLPQKMDGGACIKIKDSSLLCHPVMIKHMEDCAKKAGVKYQFEILTYGGTDSGAIHVNKGGVPSGCVSIATRYIHSMNEMASLSDIEESIKLTVAVLENEIV